VTWQVIRFLAVPAALLLVSTSPPAQVDSTLITGDTLPAKLSDFRFFNGAQPNRRVVVYALTTPLFSDYAEKDRYVFVPEGQSASFDAAGKIMFPVGSAIIKTFRHGDVKIETRVLLHRASGWVALPYVWQGNEAVLKRAGLRTEVLFQGKLVSYAVPNVNQCKECHQSGDSIIPIGPKASNLSGDQLARWRAMGLLTGTAKVTPMPRWDDTKAPLDARARAYLDVNCAHCHYPKGAASNSGLVLTWGTTDRVALGIGKTPVAAGRGSGGMSHAIEPGDPANSFMLYRLKSTEPGIAMPELGRSMTHEQGVKLLTEWIAAMPQAKAVPRPRT
jgi:uncharacterized repeat protein (TIGR03806 family)